MTTPTEQTYCIHCEKYHTIPARTSETLAETVAANHALRVARLRLGWLWNEQGCRKQEMR